MMVAVDFDGVLYPRTGFFEVEERVIPLHLLSGPLNIVTGRWESSRPKVLNWLHKHEFCVNSLQMMPDKGDQESIEFKHQALEGFGLYITDDPVEAKALATRDLRVLCLEDVVLYLRREDPALTRLSHAQNRGTTAV